MPDIQHIFVLMLENRSFDHLLGQAGIKGIDAETGIATKIDGLAGEFIKATLGPMESDPGMSFQMLWSSFADRA